ncbi:hypothetical protein HDU83_008993 [Entophlyctis luteolus]|nr:hypothetical protein HDU83_008993 [Entophlyctis luteolus]
MKQIVSDKSIRIRNLPQIRNYRRTNELFRRGAAMESLNTVASEEDFSRVLDSNDNGKTSNVVNPATFPNNDVKDSPCPSATAPVIPLVVPEVQECLPAKVALIHSRSSTVSDRELSPSIFRCRRTVATKPQRQHQQQQQQQSPNISPLHILQLQAQLAALQHLAGYDCPGERHQQRLHSQPLPLPIKAPDQSPAHPLAAWISPLVTAHAPQDVVAPTNNATATNSASASVDATAAPTPVAALPLSGTEAGSPCVALAARVQALVFENAALRQTLAGIALATGLQRHQMQQQRMQLIAEQQEALEVRQFRHEMLVGVAGCGKQIGGWLADVRARMERGECWRQGRRAVAGLQRAIGIGPNSCQGTNEEHNHGDGDEDDAEVEDDWMDVLHTSSREVWDGVVRGQFS